MAQTQAVTVVDLSRYSDIARELEQQLGTSAVVSLNDQILEMIYTALQRVGVPRTTIPFKYTGDGAIILFATVFEASTFAESLHHIARDHNRDKQIPHAQRHFRIGIAIGPVEVVAKTAESPSATDLDLAGLTIANAVRLEAACKTGEILISSEAWADLPKDVRSQYDLEEEVKGKRGERFRVHRRAVVPAAPWDAESSLKAGKETQSADSSLNDHHLRDIIQIQRRVEAHLEKQVKLMGPYCPPHIQIQLEDVRKTIRELTAQLSD